MIEALTRNVLAWAADEPAIAVVLLVGSHARAEAKPDSDVDLVLLVDEPVRFVADHEWPKRFGVVHTRAVEDWGAVTSVRVTYADGIEVEFGFSTLAWITTPLDPGTRRVLEDGYRVLYDPGGRVPGV